MPEWAAKLFAALAALWARLEPHIPALVAFLVGRKMEASANERNQSRQELEAYKRAERRVVLTGSLSDDELRAVSRATSRRIRNRLAASGVERDGD